MRNKNVKATFLLAWTLVFSPYFLFGLIENQIGLGLLLLGIIGTLSIALSNPEGLKQSWMESPVMLGLLFVHNLIFSDLSFVMLKDIQINNSELLFMPILITSYILVVLYSLRFLWQIIKNSESGAALKTYSVSLLIAAFLTTIIETIAGLLLKIDPAAQASFYSIISKVMYPLTFIKKEAFNVASMFNVHFSISPIEQLATNLISAVMVGSAIFVVLYLVLLPFRKMHLD